MTKKIIFFALLFALIVPIFASAHEEETFAQAEEIIRQKISCDELTENQLEILGDYYMEQMHPGELHEIMDERMGGEGSESLRQVHINMGLAFYCGEPEAMPSGMMNNMMGRGMMGSSSPGYGMMGYYGNSAGAIGIFILIIWTLVLATLVLFIIWISKQLSKKRGRK